MSNFWSTQVKSGQFRSFQIVSGQLLQNHLYNNLGTDAETAFVLPVSAGDSKMPVSSIFELEFLIDLQPLQGSSLNTAGDDFKGLLKIGENSVNFPGIYFEPTDGQNYKLGLHFNCNNDSLIQNGQNITIDTDWSFEAASKHHVRLRKTTDTGWFD